MVVGNPLAGEFQLSLQAPEVHQIAVLHRLAQFVVVGWVPLPEVEDAVGVFVDFRLGCSGQANQMGVKIVENRLVFLVYAPVDLVPDDEVEMPHGKQLSALLIPGVVNAAYHGLVGGEHRPSGKIFPVLAEVGEAQVR